MSRRTAGISLLAISAFLYATRFFAAAIWGAGFTSWSNENFYHLLSYVDQGLSRWSIVAMVAGVAYLLWAEIGNRKGAA